MEHVVCARVVRLLRRARASLTIRVGWLAERRPEWVDSWGGPFNGQRFRQRIFAELSTSIPLAAIVETGTFHGTTTRHFRRVTGVPIHSFEANPRHHGFARAHLRWLPDVHLHHGDSRRGLRQLAKSGALPAGPVFFYFDAHGLGDLPLAEEVELAFRHWPQALVMIDDFAVSDDPGYAFDDFGDGQALTLDYLFANGILPPGVWFPACDAGAETGARRGCVVLVQAADVMRRVDEIRTLRRWTPRPRPEG